MRLRLVPWLALVGLALLPTAARPAEGKSAKPTLVVRLRSLDGLIYEANVPQSPLPIYFRFANKYVYATVREKEAIAPANLLEPSAVLPEAEVGTLSLQVNLDEIPDELKRMALGQMSLQMANAREKE